MKTILKEVLANCNNFRQYAFANTIFDVVTHSELLSQKFEQLAYPYIGNEHNTKKCDCTLAIIIDDRYFACIEKKYWISSPRLLLHLIAP